MKQNKNLIFLLLVLISGFISLSISFRFLHFNQTNFINRTLILLLLLLLSFSLIRLTTGLFLSFFNHKSNSLFILLAFIVVIPLFILLPYKPAPFRTVHNIKITIPPDSKEVNLIQLLNSDLDKIDLTGFGIDSPKTTIILLYPGQSVSYERAMTGGIIAYFSAISFPAGVEITWDGVMTKYEIDEKNPNLIVKTDPYSWGKPEKRHAALAILNLISDSISCIYFILLLIAWAWNMLNGQPIKLQSISSEQELHVYKLVLHILFIFLAIFSYQLNEHANFLPFSIMTLSLILWFLPIFRKVLKKDFIPFYLIFITIGCILGNIIIGKAGLFFYPIQINKISTTINDLMKVVRPDTSTTISIAFYKQLDHANIIYPNNMDNNFQIKPSRLLQMNKLESIHAADYSSTLRIDQYNALITNKNTIKFPNTNLGNLYLLESTDNTTRTYALYFYEKDIFLIPPYLMR